MKTQCSIFFYFKPITVSSVFTKATICSAHIFCWQFICPKVSFCYRITIAFFTNFPDVYLKDPFPKKVRDKDAMQKYLDADEKLSTVSMKIEYYQVMINYIDSILKQVSNRTYQIKNSIEFLRFQSGYG